MGIGKVPVKETRHFSFTFYAEYLMASFAIAWGAWLAILHPVAAVIAYRKLEMLIPLWIIELIFITCGIGILLFPVLKIARRYFHLVLFAAWLTVSCSFFYNDFFNTGGLVYLTVALLHGGFFWRFTSYPLPRVREGG